MKRAEKHLDPCEDKECKYCSNGTCCFGLRKFGCADEIGIEDNTKEETVEVKPKEINKGGSITMRHDSIDGEEFIRFFIDDETEILKVSYFLWSDKTAGFTPEIRDEIIDRLRRCYG